MHPDPTPSGESLPTTPEEQTLLRQLRGNPLLAEQIRAIANKFESEIANGMDAHQAEAALVESLRELGKSMMSQWAWNTQKHLIASHPGLNKHVKKNSAGTPPSA